MVVGQLATVVPSVTDVFVAMGESAAIAARQLPFAKNVQYSVMTLLAITFQADSPLLCQPAQRRQSPAPPEALTWLYPPSVCGSEVCLPRRGVPTRTARVSAGLAMAKADTHTHTVAACRSGMRGHYADTYHLPSARRWQSGLGRRQGRNTTSRALL